MHAHGWWWRVVGWGGERDAWDGPTREGERKGHRRGGSRSLITTANPRKAELKVRTHGDGVRARLGDGGLLHGEWCGHEGLHAVFCLGGWMGVGVG